MSELLSPEAPRTEALIEQMAAGKGASDLIALARELELENGRMRAVLADLRASRAMRYFPGAHAILARIDEVLTEKR